MKVSLWAKDVQYFKFLTKNKQKERIYLKSLAITFKKKKKIINMNKNVNFIDSLENFIYSLLHGYRIFTIYENFIIPISINKWMMILFGFYGCKVVGKICKFLNNEYKIK